MSTGFSQARGSLAILQTDSESNIEKGLMIEENQDEELVRRMSFFRFGTNWNIILTHLDHLEWS